MSKKTLGIYGAGGLGREVLELALIINDTVKEWDNFIFIVDKEASNGVNEVNGIKVFDYEEAKKQYSEALGVVVGIGEPMIRKEKFEQLKKDGIATPTLIHPSVHIPESTEVGEGVIINTGCSISCNVTIEDYVFIQPLAVIGHDVFLSYGCLISSFVVVSGYTKVGAFTFIGISTALKEKVSIGDYSIIGMGSVVYRDIPDEVIALGNPAKVRMRNIDRKVFGL